MLASCEYGLDESEKTDASNAHDATNPHISINSIRLIGLLWCDGSPKEKAFEFYDMLQDNDQKSIAASDKDFLPAFKHLLNTATELVFRHAPVFTKTGGEFSQVSLEQVKEKQEEYEDLCDEFLDEVFGTESTLERSDWEEEFVEKMSYLLDPVEIRKKLGF